MNSASKHRPVIITGNWKMHKTIAEAIDFVKKLAAAINGCHEVFLAVPFTMLYPLKLEISGSFLTLGAQNVNDAAEGAYTGEISSKMLKDAGAQFVLIGHSERRQLFQESDLVINNKVKRAVAEGLRPVLCVGETKVEHVSGKTAEILTRQIKEGLNGISADSLAELIIAYEPVWAIGKGESATPEIAQAAHRQCRQCLKDLFGAEMSEKIVIQYGGSVTAKNAAALLNQPDIDGLLVGNASLSLESFVAIVNNSSKQ